MPQELSVLFNDPVFSVKVGEKTLPPYPAIKIPTEAALNTKGELLAYSRAEDGVPFSISDNTSLPQDTATLAYKILWNMQSVFWSQHFFTYDFTLHYKSQHKTKTSVQGSFSRIYPFTLGDSYPADQIFRELVKLTNPQAVSNYAWLSFRLKSNDPDLVWIFSPFLKKEREIAPSLRDEKLFFSELSASNLLAFSGKPENYDVRVVEKKEYLAPLLKKELVENSSQPPLPCFSPFPAKEEDLFSNRLLWKLELTNREPYSPTRKVILYIDSETYLPLYAFEYNNQRKLEKAVITRFDLFPLPQHGIPFRFVLRSTFVENIATQSGALLTIQGGKICEAPPHDWSLRNFDPSFPAKPRL